LTADRNYYVRTDGSDSNTGLANTSGGAFLTLQHAVSVVAQISGGGKKININIADGTYTCDGIELPNHNSYEINIIGNTTTPANVVLQAPDWAAFHIYHPSLWKIQCVKIETTSSCWGAIYLALGARLEVIECIIAMDGGGTAFILESSYCNVRDITFSGNTVQEFVQANHGSVFMCFGSTLTVLGDVTFTGGFVKARSKSQINFGGSTITAAGTITGTRYIASELSLIDGNGSSTYFPGSVAGTTATGAQYV
jgi:hypothetical protein